MPNTRSAYKAVRSSNRKKTYNLFWKNRIREVVKNIRKELSKSGGSADILKEEERLLYKIVDKAAKKNVIHKNKASRMKSRISKKIAAHEKKPKAKPAPKKTTAKSKSSK